MTKRVLLTLAFVLAFNPTDSFALGRSKSKEQRQEVRSFIEAALYGDKNKVEEELRNNPSLIHAHYEADLASHYVRFFIVEKNQLLKEGLTALHAAAYGGHEEIVELLLNQALHEQTPLDINLATEVVNKDKSQSDYRWLKTGLSTATGLTKNRFCQRFYLGKDPITSRLDYACLNFGGTALQAAARRGHTAIVNELIAHGADVNQKAPLDWTFCLLGSEAINNTPQIQLTPLMEAAYFGHKDVVSALIAAGASVEETTQTCDKKTTQTALDFAQQNVNNSNWLEKHEIVEILHRQKSI